MVAIYEGSIQQLRGYVVVQFTTCWCTPSGCRYGPQRRTVSVRHPDHPDNPALLLHHVRPTSIQGELNDTEKRANGIDPDRIDPIVHACVYCHSPAAQECPRTAPGPSARSRRRCRRACTDRREGLMFSEPGRCADCGVIDLSIITADTLCDPCAIRAEHLAAVRDELVYGTDQDDPSSIYDV